MSAVMNKNVKLEGVAESVKELFLVTLKGFQPEDFMKMSDLQGFSAHKKNCIRVFEAGC